jgi:Fe-S oxidoreductase
MAKLKYEFLAQYYARYGTPLRARLFGNIARFNQLGSTFAPFSNWVAQSNLFRRSLDRFLGIDARRPLPTFARQTFAQWFQAHSIGTRPAKRGKVALFNDTFTNFNAPEVGRAAVQVLEALGYQVVLPEKKCCGRPMISKGLIAKAKENAQWNVSNLVHYADENIPVLGLEPSCLLTLRNDYLDLVDDANARRVAENAFLVDEFVAQKVEEEPEVLRLKPLPGPVLFHGHCHQKAIVSSTPSIRALRAIPNVELQEVDSGCCGMAGSFGFEKEHYAVSEALSMRRLIPAVQASKDALVVAPGVSCRQQISHFSGRHPLHTVQVLAQTLILH